MAVFFPCALAQAQRSTTPIVLVDGYDFNGCPQRQNVADVFGALQGLLVRDGSKILFFDDCVWPNQTIENLGGWLARGISNFIDRTGAESVDVVAYSMGGLIAREVLSMNPHPPIRKLILIGTPNLGTGWGGLALNSQGQEMMPNSVFLRNLNSISEHADMIAIAGLANGLEGDGLVGLWSAALNNLGIVDARTRVISACHGPGVPTCTGTSIAFVTGEEHPTYQIIRSFLDDTTAWLSIGLSPTQAIAARTQPQVVLPPRAVAPMQPRIFFPAPPLRKK